MAWTEHCRVQIDRKPWVSDGDNDMWAYAYMKGWNESEHIEFDFHDAHDLRPLTDRAAKKQSGPDCANGYPIRDKRLC